MFCPRCGQEQFCPCSSCHKKNKDKITWEWEDNGYVSICGGCGFSRYIDWWADLDIESTFKTPDDKRKFCEEL